MVLNKVCEDCFVREAQAEASTSVPNLVLWRSGEKFERGTLTEGTPSYRRFDSMVYLMGVTQDWSSNFSVSLVADERASSCQNLDGIVYLVDVMSCCQY